eukprot:gene10656-22242_t
MIKITCWTILKLCLVSIVYSKEGLKELLDGVYSPPLMNLENFTGPLLHMTEKGMKFSCMKLYRERSSTPPLWPPPVDIPSNLSEYYTMGGVIPVFKRYFKEQQNNGSAGYNWTTKRIEAQMKRQNSCGNYRNPNCNVTLHKYSEKYIRGKRGIVVGSQLPWAEASLLVAGAAHLTTIEYMRIRTDHPQLTAITPEQSASLYLNNKWEHVDFAFSYSSLEHDGLGRYGDPLNPFADLEDVAKIYCLLKPGGILFLGFAVGPDSIVWNGQRIYGKYRLRPILQYWNPIDLIGDYADVVGTDGYGERKQPIFVLQKPLQDEFL